KEQGAQGLVLRGGRHLALNSQGGQERGDLGGAHLGWVALAVEEDVAFDPVHVGFLGAPAVVAVSSGGAGGGGGGAGGGGRGAGLSTRPRDAAITVVRRRRVVA